MNNIVITSFEIVYDIQDKRNALRRYRKTFYSAHEARAYYEAQIAKQYTIDAFCTVRISQDGQMHFKRVAQYYREKSS